MKKLFLMVMILFYSACSRTATAWSNTPVKEYFEVYGKEDLPSKLEEKKVEYKCTDLVYSSEGYTKKCYVTKSSAEKVTSWSSRLYETSKGILLDTGENMIVLGVLALCAIAHSNECTNINFSEMKE